MHSEDKIKHKKNAPVVMEKNLDPYLTPSLVQGGCEPSVHNITKV